MFLKKLQCIRCLDVCFLKKSPISDASSAFEEMGPQEFEEELAVEALDFDFCSVDKTDFIDSSLTKWEVPLFYQLKETLTYRHTILIKGIVLETADKFTVDLTREDPEEDNQKEIIFHFNPRFKENYIARNCFLSGSWDAEENRSPRKNPFKRGKRFQLEIFISPSEYLVAVNGSHFCGFAHKVSPNIIKAIEIYGDIKLKKLDIIPSNVYPSQPYYISEKKQESLEIPLILKLDKSASIDTKYLINGRVKLLPEFIELNLQGGHHCFPRPFVPYHMSIRWKPLSQDIAVFNSWVGKWEEELVIPMNLKFIAGQPFVISITLEAEGFKTEVNGSHFSFFQYRLDHRIINTIFIKGDCEIFSIKRC